MVEKLTILQALDPFLTRFSEQLHLAYISRELSEPHPTLRQWLNALEIKGVLKKQYKGRLTLYSLNLKHPNIIDYLVIAEKGKLIRKCEESVVLAELVSSLYSLQENVKVLIFGSAADSFNHAQDIDILIIGKTDVRALHDMGKRINKEIHIIQGGSLEKISKPLRGEIIKKHLLVKGSEDFLRWMIWQQ